MEMANIIRLILMLLPAGLITQGLTWYVKPEGTKCFSHMKHCNTLDRTINYISNGFGGRNLTLLFLPGTYILCNNLEFSNMEHLTLRGWNSSLATNITCNTSRGIGFHFGNISKVAIKLIGITYCSTNFGKKVQAAMHVSQVSLLIMAHVRIEHSRGCGLYVERVLETQLEHCYFNYNYCGLDYINTNFLFTWDINVSLNITHSAFLNSAVNEASDERHHATGIIVFSLSPFFFMSLKHCLIDNNTRNVLIKLNSSSFSPTNTYISIHNTNITSGKGLKGAGLSYYILPMEPSGDEVSCNKVVNTNILIIKHTQFAFNEATYAAGGMLLDLHDSICTSNTIKLYNCCFSNNSLQSNLIERSTGAALLVIRHMLPTFGEEVTYLKYTILSIKKTSFHNNSVFNPKGAVVEFRNSQNAEFNRCYFLNNIGTALSLHSASVIFSNYVAFHHNSATFGSAIQFCETSYFFIRNSTTVVFRNNRASQRGGAIYGHKSCLDKHNFCFFQPIVDRATNITHLQIENKMKLVFENNTAVRAGDNIYGGNIDNCYTYGKFYNKSSTSSHYISGDVFDNIAEFRAFNTNTSISSDPYFIHFCNLSTNESSNMTWPGNTIQVLVQPLGQRHGFTRGLIEVVFNESQISASISRSFSLDALPLDPCESINITILSKYINITTELIFQLQSSVPIEDVMVATLHVTIQHCPWGYYLNNWTSKCECERLIIYRNCECIANTIKCSKPLNWVGCDNETSCVSNNDTRAVHCSVNYCKSKAVITADTINNQCVTGRMGIGCGKCRQNYSAVLGTSNCKLCSNSHLWLIAIYLLSGIFLIVLLMKFNITVANGTVNSIIFYANFIYTSKDIFLPERFSNRDVPRIVISWLNLDLGIEVCFYKGMTTYQKTWLQFGYILYIWSLQIAIVYLCRKYIFFTRICGRNVTKVMATLLLISYMKVLHVIQMVLGYHNMELSAKEKQKVWMLNPAIRFASAKHLPLLVAATMLGFILVCFTVCLLAIQVLKKVSDKKGLTWVSRLQPFFDAFTGPCNPNYGFWPGFLFIMRIALITLDSFHSFYSTKDEAITSCAVAILVIVFSFLFPSGVYRKWSLNILELSIMLNLSLLSGLVNYYSTDNSKVQHLTYISMFMSFFSLFCYKYKQIYKVVRKMCLTFIKGLTQKFSNPFRNNKFSERISSSGANEVTRSEIQVSIPPNESSRLLNVTSSPRAKSLHDPRETLLEYDD